jgi:hypothetical protein
LRVVGVYPSNRAFKRRLAACEAATERNRKDDSWAVARYARLP